MGRMATAEQLQQSSRAQTANTVRDNTSPAADSAALSTVDEEQEIAFWDDVLKAKAVHTDSQGSEATAAAPISPRRLSHRQKRDKKITIANNRRPAAPLERNGEQAVHDHMPSSTPRLPTAFKCCKVSILLLWGLVY